MALVTEQTNGLTLALWANMRQIQAIRVVCLFGELLCIGARNSGKDYVAFSKKSAHECVPPFAQKLKLDLLLPRNPLLSSMDGECEAVSLFWRVQDNERYEVPAQTYHLYEIPDPPLPPENFERALEMAEAVGVPLWMRNIDTLTRLAKETYEELCAMRRE